MATLTGVPPSTRHLTLEDGSARLDLEGELDIAAEPSLASPLDRSTARAAFVVADLRSVAFLSCGALRLLLRASGRTQGDGRPVIVVRGQAPPERPRLPRS